MRFGLSFLPDCRLVDMTAADYYRNALSLSEQAEQGGMYRVKMTEHYLHPYGGYCPSPLTFLAAVAARTERMRLMTGGVLPAFHHPIELAAQAAQVDSISGGRLEIGFARAYMPYEFEAFGIDMDTSRARFTETIRAVRRLWTDESVAEETPFFSYRNVTCLPRPVQRPHPPLWAAATVSPESFRWIGEQGMGLLITPTLTPPSTYAARLDHYRSAFQRNRQGPGTVAASLPVYVGDNSQQAVEAADFYLQRYLNVWSDACQAWTARRSSDYPGYEQLAYALSATSPQAVRGELGAIAGSPDEVTDQLGQVTETLGVRDVLLQMDFGAMDLNTAKASVERFCDKVLPQFADDRGA
jgi:alkanesulfonate monooxygenase SsuD/methylene tetrahydromethanopterin reductase-like flavin-dependent oxidoreductase (luciferase family)